jgi:hypothetical protein
MPVKRNTISLDEGIHELAKEQADKMHMNFSEYIAHLVRKEFDLYINNKREN